MSILKSDYEYIEENIEWPQEPSRIMGGDQFYRLVTELKKKIRERSLEENLDSNLYDERLNKMLDFVSNLQSALNNYSHDILEENKNKQHIWRHRYKLLQQYKDSFETTIDRFALLKSAVTYLANPWLQHEHIDWIFIDSMIFNEISVYKESIMSGQIFGKIDWVYFFADGNIEKFILFKLLMNLGFTCLRYIIPPAIIFILYYFQYKTAFLITAAIYAIYLIFYFIRWPLRYYRKKLENKTLHEHTERLQKMVNAYCYCEPPIISLPILHSFINKSVEVDAMYPGALFSILKKQQNENDVLMPFPEPAFRF